jgi:hypothetical protein
VGAGGLGDSLLELRKQRLVPRNDWIRAVYEETSGYIHFSNRPIKAARRVIDEARSSEASSRGRATWEDPSAITADYCGLSDGGAACGNRSIK